MTSEDVLRALLDVLPQNVIWTDAKGVILGANRNFHSYTGLEDLTGKTVFDLPISREDADTFHRGDLEILNGSQFELDVLRAITIRGEERWARLVRKPITDLHGNIVGILGTHLDVTDQVRAENEASFLRSLIESTTDPIYALNPEENWKLVYANNALCQHFGYSREKLFSMRIPDWDPDFEVKTLDPNDKNVIEFLKLFESRHQLADGRIIPVEISSVFFEHGGKTYTGGVCRDISRRKEIELRLRLQSAALESAANAIAITDESGAIWWGNPAFCDLTGYSFEEVIGQNLRLLKSGRMSAAFYEEMWKTIRQGNVWHGELINRRKDGSIYDEEMTIAPVRDAKGAVTHYIAVKQDISARKQTEIELARARDAAIASARLKSEFLANMSHEIRTPMNAILGMNGMLLDTPLTAEQREFAQTVQTSAEALLTLLNDILDLSKIEADKLALEKEDFDLRETLEDAIELLAEAAQAKNIELTGLLSPGVCTHLHGDPGRIKQILLNLIGNAIKFTEQGEVVVRVSEDRREKEQVTLCFEIEDTGIGIPEEAQERLFQAFTQVDGSITRRYGGTGLGLAISRRLVELMGGYIQVKKSQPGLGSIFCFILQMEDAHAALPLTQPKLDNLTGLNVLVVDDNPTNGFLLHHQLTSWGIHDTHACSAKEALQIMREQVISGIRFDLAILDMQMPEIDGIALARMMNADPALSNIRKILLTSFGTKPPSHILQEVNISECLLKPIRRSRLFDCLRRVLSGVLDVAPATLPLGTASLNERSGRNLRILLAEDNAVNQKVILLQLKKLGHEAHVAANGLQVLSALESRRYDVILMDCQMPEMEGCEATRRIREKERLSARGEHIHIIALTANAMESDREKCFSAGMDDYLAKPLRIQDLTDALGRLPLP